MTIPPTVVVAGGSGHITAHEDIAGVLTDQQNQLGGLPAMAWGTAVLTAGTVTVPAGSVTASSVILVSRLTPSGTLGHLSVPAVTPGVSFVISSDSASEASEVAYLVLG